MKLSIKVKLILLSTAMILLVIGIMASVFLFRERSLVRENIVNKAKVQVTRLGSATRNGWYSSDRDLTFVDLMSTYKKVPNLIYVFIVDIRGKKEKIEVSTGGSQSKTTREELAEKFWKPFPKELKKGQLQYSNRDEPLVLDWKAENEEILDFALPVFHPIRKNEKIVLIRMGISTREIDEKTRQTTITILAISAVLLLLGAGLGFSLGWYLSTPIQKLARHALQLGTGDFSLRINLKRGDELGDLSNSINSMAESLEEGEKIKLDKARIDEQIGLAKEIQEGLNPSNFYNKSGLEVKGFTKAAKGIGGDYFDFIDIDDENVVILVSDVSGKDIPASLIMIMIRTVLNTLIKEDKKKGTSSTTQKLVETINEIMSSDFAIDKFATMLLLIINRKTGDLYFTNAGHNPVIIYRAELERCTHIPLDGLPIGVDEDSEYKMGHTVLKKGDITILYSDGVTEAWNNKKEEYQKERVLKNLIDFHPLNAEEINEKMVEEIWKFMDNAPQHDDTTLVVVKKS